VQPLCAVDGHSDHFHTLIASMDECFAVLISLNQGLPKLMRDGNPLQQLVVASYFGVIMVIVGELVDHRCAVMIQHRYSQRHWRQ
jgi:hypothetical protein